MGVRKNEKSSTFLATLLVYGTTYSDFSNSLSNDEKEAFKKCDKERIQTFFETDNNSIL